MNLYDVLGVASTATGEEIKKAYRKKAMEHHPDRGGDKAKFQEVQGAYDTLGDESKRKAYDARQTAGFRSSNPKGNSWSRYGTSSKDIDDIIKEMYSRGSAKGTSDGFRSWDDIMREVRKAQKAEADKEEQWSREYDEDEWEREYNEYEEYQKNEDVTVNYTVTLEEAFSGKEVNVTIKHHGKPRTVSLTIPPGIETGKKVRAAGGGSTYYKHQKPGDLYVNVNVAPKDRWERKAQHLYHTVDIDVLDLMGGGSVQVDTMDGTRLEVQIRAGTPLTATIRIPGRGMPVLGDVNVRGDMFLVINPVIKTATDPEALELIAKLKDLIS